MRSWLPLGLTMALVASTPSHAQVPTEADFEAAVTLARADPGAAEMEIRTDGVAMQQWRERLPLAAWRIGRRCHIGFNPWLANMRFAWLFPALPPAQRKLWLGGLIAHEIAHCRHAEHAAAAGAGTSVEREAVADLAFALHVDRDDGSGTALVDRLAVLRETQARLDPGHATHAALRCYLAQRRNSPLAQLQSIDTWQARCVDQLIRSN
jgi:hypothetical protein